MIVTRLKLPLEQAEYEALTNIAIEELRNPTDQVRFILRQELERRGLLKPDPSTQAAAKLSQPMQAGEGVKNGDQ